MNILQFIQGLLPTFGRNKVVEASELTQTSIRENTLPAFKTAEELFKGQKFKSKEAQNFQLTYNKRVGALAGNTMVGSIREGLEGAIEMLKALAAESKEIYAETESNVSLTYLKATYLRLIEASEFANNYSRKWLNYLFILETGETDEGATKLRNHLTPAEVMWLENGFNDFCMCIEVMRRDPKDIAKALKGLPDSTITELTEKTLPAMLGEKAVDPFSLRHLSVQVNPFYFIGMLKAEYQANKYKGAKAELELLQLRKLNLEKLLAKSPDARLEKEIEYMANRVSGLNYDIDKMEKEYLHA